jgi:single-strand DNA-binding protein
MNSFNSVTLVGNLGDAPTIRQAGDIDVASFSMATSHNWYSDKKQNDDGTTGGWESKTTWHRITLWKPGKSIKDAKKGDRVLIQGRYESNSWQDNKTGETRYSMEVIASSYWVIPKGSNAFQTEPEKEAKKEAKATNDLDEALGGPPERGEGFPDEAPY